MGFPPPTTGDLFTSQNGGEGDQSPSRHLAQFCRGLFISNLNFCFCHSLLCPCGLIFSFTPGILAASFDLAVTALLFVNPHRLCPFWHPPAVCSVDIQARVQGLALEAQIQLYAVLEAVCLREVVLLKPETRI